MKEGPSRPAVRFWPQAVGPQSRRLDGLVPRQHSTGGKDRLGRISKQGNRHLRWLLVAGAMAVICKNWYPNSRTMSDDHAHRGTKDYRSARTFAVSSRREGLLLRAPSAACCKVSKFSIDSPDNTTHWSAILARRRDAGYEAPR